MCDYPHVVVTGASSRIGRAVTMLLAASGYHVYAGVSSYADGIALHQHTPPGAGVISPLLLDVGRPVQIGAAARTVTAHAGASGLAGLVNNADIGVFGQLAVTRAFVPLLRQAQGRIVITGCASAAMCEAVRRELAPWNTRVVLIGPAGSPSEAAARAVAQALTTPRPRALLTAASCP
jgi:NAD(P)-dependent dehydrogenase (short-subunit alcohol dehydrogenase family)